MSERYIRRLYHNLIELDWDDFVTVGTFKVKAFGNYVEVRNGNYEFSLSENERKEIYVHEKRLAPVGVMSPEGVIIKTNWVEVYRTNKLVTPSIFPLVLKDVEKAIDKKAKEES